MKTSQIACLGLALILVVQVAATNRCRGECTCGLGGGSNACGCNEFVVRAAKPIRPVSFASPSAICEAATMRAATAPCGSPRSSNGDLSVQDLVSMRSPQGLIAPRFQPVGDLCSTCNARKSIAVIPGYPVKPVCLSCMEAMRSNQANCNDAVSRSSFTSLANSDLNDFEYGGSLSFDEQENIYNGNSAPVAPADAVSLSLAYGLAQQVARTVPEERLFFGQRSMPEDGRIVKTRPDIPEERLLIVDRPIVELKAAPRARSNNGFEDDIAEEEALEQQRLEMEAEAAQVNQSPSAVITYSDLGYAPVTSNGNTFVNVGTDYSNTGFEAAEDCGCGAVGPALPGYRSGNVIVRSSDQEGDDDYDNENVDGSYSSEDGEDDGDDGEQNTGILARLRAAARSQSSGCGCGR